MLLKKGSIYVNSQNDGFYSEISVSVFFSIFFSDVHKIQTSQKKSFKVFNQTILKPIILKNALQYKMNMSPSMCKLLQE